jgi:hypothetical protein
VDNYPIGAAMKRRPVVREVARQLVIELTRQLHAFAECSSSDGGCPACRQEGFAAGEYGQDLALARTTGAKREKAQRAGEQSGFAQGIERAARLLGSARVPDKPMPPDLLREYLDGWVTAIRSLHHDQNRRNMDRLKEITPMPDEPKSLETLLRELHAGDSAGIMIWPGQFADELQPIADAQAALLRRDAELLDKWASKLEVLAEAIETANPNEFEAGEAQGYRFAAQDLRKR